MDLRHLLSPLPRRLAGRGGSARGVRPAFVLTCGVLLSLAIAPPGRACLGSAPCEDARSGGGLSEASGLARQACELYRRAYGREPGFLRAAGDSDACPEIVGHGLVGVGATAEFYMRMESVDPEYRALWEGALVWIENDARPGNPGYQWEAIYCDTIPGPARITATWNAEVFARGYLMSGDAAYLPVVDSALVWVDSEKLPASLVYPGSDGLIWVEWEYASIPPHFYSLGPLSGVTGIGRTALEVYRITGRSLARTFAEGVGRTLRDAKVAAPVGHYWPMFGGGPNDPGQPTAFCGGAAGVAEFLLEMDATFGSSEPDYKALALGALDWLESIAEPEAGGLKWGKDLVVWPGVYTTTPGFGTAGVGRAFLKAYERYGDPNHLFLAREAGDWLLSQGVSGGGGTLLNWPESSGVTPRSSWCRGSVGVLHYLWRLGQVTGDTLYSNAALRGAAWLESIEQLTVQGPVIPNVPGGIGHGTDWIWGMVGLLHPYYDDGAGLLGTEPFRTVAVHVADYLAQVKIPGPHGGHYWLARVGFDPQAVAAPRPARRRGVDEFDARIWPNPSAGPSEILVRLGPCAAREVRVGVVDVGGRRVRSLSLRLAPGSAGGEVRVPWDGRDDRGRLVPQGVYFLRVRAGAQERTLKVAVVR